MMQLVNRTVSIAYALLPKDAIKRILAIEKRKQ